MKLIDKDALVAEIEEKISINETCQKISGGHDFYRGAIDEAKEIISIIDTLEVKEVEWTEEDMKLIWTIGDDIPYMTEEEFYKELLKRYKAQKGEEV